ncbi:MAG: tol-pal system protein YbgF [Saccharospirillaceae bacterium]|nr:tol-pal system protein YbgF [Pseudomonadales bacterium]NRB78542.1 tol-pal system protein YbgF [Saccharospirillaceae bacterium]
MKIFKTSFLFSAALLSSTFVCAANIEEVTVQTNKNPQQEILNELLYNVTDLLNEVSILSGTVDEQAYQLNRIESQHKKRYLEMDKRIAQLTLKIASLEKELENAAITPISNITSAQGSATSTAALVIKQKGSEQYAQAIAFLQKQDYKNAKKEFELFIEQFPNSQRMPNAMYWLGKVYLKLNNTKKANSMFFQTQQNFPKNPKAASSLIEMADISVQKNNIVLAKKYLVRVVKEFAHDPTAKQAQLRLDGLNGE